MAKNISNRAFKLFFQNCASFLKAFRYFSANEQLSSTQLNQPIYVPISGRLSPLIKPLPTKDNRKW